MKLKPQLIIKVEGTHTGSFHHFVFVVQQSIASSLITYSKFDETGKLNFSFLLSLNVFLVKMWSQNSFSIFNETEYLDEEIFSQVMDDFAKTWVT